MPRAGLNTSEVVASGAELADESGIESVSLAALAGRLGVKAPALCKHVDGIGDLQHRIATLAMTGVGNEKNAAQNKRLQEYLPERGIRLHNVAQIGPVDFQQRAGFQGPRADQSATTRE